MMKYYFLALFLCCNITFFSQNSNLDSVSPIDSLTEKGDSDSAEKTSNKKESLFNYFSKRDVFEIKVISLKGARHSLMSFGVLCVNPIVAVPTHLCSGWWNSLGHSNGGFVYGGL